MPTILATFTVVLTSEPDGTPLVTAGPEQVGRAALFGGTTTFIDFAYWRDGLSAMQAIETRDKDFVGKSPCDWAYHLMLHTEPPPMPTLMRSAPQEAR